MIMILYIPSFKYKASIIGDIGADKRKNGIKIAVA